MLDMYNHKAEQKQLIELLESNGFLKSLPIINAFINVPRHLFVTSAYRDYAYQDIPLPIAGTATISQPSVVASMLEELQPGSGERVLEIGTGSGWMAALIGYCVGTTGRVLSIEMDLQVAEFARKNISSIGMKNISIISGDGSGGYEDRAPYDKIIYSAAMSYMPKVVISQLRNGGRIVAPIGSKYQQRLVTIDKLENGKLSERYGWNVIFSPIRGKYGLEP